MNEESSSSESDIKFESVDEDGRLKCAKDEIISPDLTDKFPNKSIEPIITPEYRPLEEFKQKSQQSLSLNLNDIKVLEIHKENCQSYEELKEFLKALSELQVSGDVIAAAIQHDIQHDLKNIDLSELFKDHSIVIQLSSKSSNKFTIYWKSEDISFFLMLKTNEKSNFEGDQEELYKFIADFLANNLKSGHLGINSLHQPTEERHSVDIKDLADSRNFNLLLLACEAGKLNIAIHLCKLGMSTEIPDQNITAQYLALQNGHYDLIQALYEENLPLPIPPSDQEIMTYPEKFTNFILTLEEFFSMIEVDHLEKVMEIYQKLPKTRHIYNFMGESALKVAVICKAFKSYEFLLSHKHTFAPDEEPEDYYEELEYQDQFTIREIHNRYAQESTKNHINVLMTKSFIVHDVPDVEQNLKIVRRAYRTLNRNIFIRIILMIVAASKNFKIIFDFNRESINIADPTAGLNTQGMFYTSGRIYIGAKQLLDEARFHETLAIIAHEFCHFAINLVYGNNANPYKPNDNQTMQEFEEISENCKANCDKEEIIRMVYEFYPPDMFHAELIVRIVHLMAFYFNNPEKLKEVRKYFDPLFDFYELKVVPEMKEALPEIESRVDKETRIKDQKIIKFRKLSVIAGFLAVLGVVAAILVGFILYMPEYKFELLSEVDKDTIRNGLVVYKGIEVRLGQLFPKCSVAYDKMTSEHISQVLKGTLLDFKDPHLHYFDELVVHKWTNMTVNLQDKILSSNIIFQNQSIKFEDIHEVAPKSFTFLTSKNVIDILNGNEIKVGRMIENRTEFYLERIFWNEDILDIYKIYTKQNPNYLDWENEGKFRTFFDEFTSQNLSEYFYKIDNHKKFNQVKLFFASRTDNSFNVLQNFKSFHDNFENIFKKSQNSKILILSSEAGTGKTINFEQFAMRIKEEFKTKWVSYVDLKDHTKFYSQNGTVEDIQKLLMEILDLTSKSEFEKQIFNELYESGQVVLLWNGFDEISPTYNKFILNTLISIHKSTSNIQFICTRPLYSRQLTEHLDTLPYTIVPFTIDQQADFLNKFFVSRKINFNQLQNYTNKAQKIIKTLKAKTSMVKFSQEFNTPLMLVMIADLITSNIQIYNSENLYEIYENFIKKKIEIWRKKSEFAVEFLGKSITEYRNFDMIKMYQMYAFKKELKSISPLTQIVAGKLRIMRQKLPKNLTSEEISRMGILYINGKNEFKFSHKTFAEFFVAQFFIENILNPENVDDEDALVILHCFEYFTEFYGLDQVMVTYFMFSYFEWKGGSVDDGLEPKIRGILRNKFGRIFFILLRNKMIENFRFLFEFFKRDQNLLKELLKIDKNETIYTASFNCAYFPEQIDSFDRQTLKDLGKNYLTDADYEKFINGRDQKGIMLYSLYIFYRQDVGMTGQRRVYHDKYDLSPEIIENEEKMFVFEQIVKNLTQNEVKELLVSPTSPISYREFELIMNPKFWNILESLLSVEDQKVLISNLFYGLSRFNDPETYFPFLVNKSDKILQKSEIHDIFKARNILHRGILNFDLFWNFFASQTTKDQQRDILTSKIVGECYYYYLYSPNQNCYFYPSLNIFHVSLLTQHPNNHETLKTFNSVKETYGKYFTKIEMQNMILDSNDFMIYVRLGSYEVTDAFVDYLKELFKGHENLLKDFLLRKSHPTNFNIFEYLDNVGLDETNLNVKVLLDLLDFVENE